VGFAGPAFVAYADMDVAVPLNLFVLERFFLLGQVAAAPLIVLGVVLASEWLGRVAPGLRQHAEAVAAALVVLAALGSAADAYPAIDQSRNHNARRFAEDIFATLPPNAIVYVGGDEFIMPLNYLHDVEGYRPDVRIVEESVFQKDWYVQGLRRRYPDLNIPFPHYDPRFVTMRSFFEANRVRPAAFSGADADRSIQGAYRLYRRGLVEDLRPAAPLNLDELDADNERLWHLYRIPSLNTIKLRSLEPALLGHYAKPALLVAMELQRSGRTERAKEWCRRVLTVAPWSSEARDLLAQMP
jgi:hypothetical protein